MLRGICLQFIVLVVVEDGLPAPRSQRRDASYYWLYTGWLDRLDHLRQGTAILHWYRLLLRCARLNNSSRLSATFLQREGREKTSSHTYPVFPEEQ